MEPHFLQPHANLLRPLKGLQVSREREHFAGDADDYVEEDSHWLNRFFRMKGKDGFILFLNKGFHSGPVSAVPLLLRTVHSTENSLALAKSLLLSVSVLSALHYMWTAVIFIVVPVLDYGVLKYMGMWSNQGIFEHILHLARIWSCCLSAKWNQAAISITATGINCGDLER